MEVILKETINNLGEIGDVVTVKPGYGRNYLVPTRKAAYATPENLRVLGQEKEELERKQQAEKELTTIRSKEFENLNLTIEANVTEQGNLYGSIGTIDIVNSAKNIGIEIERSEVNLPHGPIKSIGEHEVTLIFHSEIQVTILVNVIGGEVAIKNTLDLEEEVDNIEGENKNEEIIEESE
jgi:large subunit ribosomal protein L9